MSASFKNHAFKEGGSGASQFPVWARKARTAVLDLPGANSDVIQTFGRKSDALALLATCTLAELNTLRGDVGTSGSLVYHEGTFSAYLDTISDPHEIATADLYVATFHFVRL